MKNLTNLFNECMNEVKNAGIKTGNIISVTINTRAKNRWGQCRKTGNAYSISISNRLLQDDVSDLAAKTTIIHEILHTVEGCMNHGNKWQNVANIINRNYGYNVKRTTSSEEKGIKTTKADYKYNVVCQKCGCTWNYNRAGYVVQHPSNYHCTCGGKLKVICNDKNIQMLSI